MAAQRHTVESLHDRLIAVEEQLDRKVEFDEEEDQQLRELLRLMIFFTNGRRYTAWIVKVLLGIGALYGLFPKLFWWIK